jgi:hypothetical protein
MLRLLWAESTHASLELLVLPWLGLSSPYREATGDQSQTFRCTPILRRNWGVFLCRTCDLQRSRDSVWGLLFPGLQDGSYLHWWWPLLIENVGERSTIENEPELLAEKLWPLLEKSLYYCEFPVMFMFYALWVAEKLSLAIVYLTSGQVAGLEMAPV